ncbi:hypothetical protein BV394_05415 [Brevirhabdus pacifica]|uniref:Uncharacterized protein n=3 Tax=Brevirhabdus pacifica TaxID=1267768 RepID=A0A1U7DH58_9RHOB|nr:hypothetical protein [Brevirhabdus pacifica]APX89223.1 hypothetical protein BV394_05415 [Brevirhabdus pacifica]OWU76732.1 hypothetical protein ATO5_10870 [Loktanella sp. 22II-4b]PJJ86172.1 hypothetical protein CLV77_0707 [Brevirhabdus pacifica]
MTIGDALAYFPDERDLAHLLPGWPDGMAAVLCLDDAGRCEVLVCHRDEGESVLRRAAGALGKARGGFAVFPEQDGYPTRRILFSEEQQLLGLILEAEDLVERAADYAINYAFARDEGLDPEDVISPRRGRARKLAPPVQAPAATDRQGGTETTAPSGLFRSSREGAGGEAPRKAEPAEARRDDDAPAPSELTDEVLTARLAAAFMAEPAPAMSMPGQLAPASQPIPAVATDPALPAGYSPLGPARRGDCQVLDARMEPRGQDLRLILRPDEAGVTTQARPAQVMGFRDDFARFVLPRHCLGSWTPDAPAILTLAAAQFPEALAQRFAEAPCAATATVTPQGIFICPLEAPARGRRRGAGARAGAGGVRGRLSLALAAGVAGVLVGLGLGDLPGAGEGETHWSRMLPEGIAAIITPANAAIGSEKRAASAISGDTAEPQAAKAVPSDVTPNAARPGEVQPTGAPRFADALGQAPNTNATTDTTPTPIAEASPLDEMLSLARGDVTARDTTGTAR